jgi:hypothetical protein
MMCKLGRLLMLMFLRGMGVRTGGFASGVEVLGYPDVDVRSIFGLWQSCDAMRFMMPVASVYLTRSVVNTKSCSQHSKYAVLYIVTP